MRIRTVAVLFAAFAIAFASHAQSLRRGIAAAAGAGAEYTQKLIDMQIEMELARQRAELQAQADARRAAAQGRAQATSQVDPDAEMRYLATKHPQYQRILTSTAFALWLNSIPPEVAQVCRRTQFGQTMVACIDAFFGPTAP